MRRILYRIPATSLPNVALDPLANHTEDTVVAEGLDEPPRCFAHALHLQKRTGRSPNLEGARQRRLEDLVIVAVGEDDQLQLSSAFIDAIRKK